MTVIRCKGCKKPIRQPQRKQHGGSLKLYCNEACRARSRKRNAPVKYAAYQRDWARKRYSAQKRNGTRRDYFLQQRYKITEEEWNAMFLRQGNACAICRTTTPRSKIGWHTDHDAKTKKIRGILCENCNRGLGMYQEDITFLRAAAAYLGVFQGTLTGKAIERASVLNPFHMRTLHHGLTYGMGGASYDLRIDQDLCLEPKQFSLASTMEYFDMPDSLLAVVHDKSSYARRGLQAFNTVIDPGWRGYLTLELVNHSNAAITLKAGDPIAQVVFHALDQPTDKPYSGKYQNQQRGPQEAR